MPKTIPNNNLPEEIESITVTFPREGVALITISSKPLGVLRHAVKRALMSTLAELENNNSVRCAVITGVGKAFSVGSDINDFSQEVGWLLENDYWESTLNQMIEDARFPVIAACKCFIISSSSVLVLACDFRVSSDNAKFGFPEVKVGAFASGSGTQRLPWLVGRGRAMELLLTGRLIGATEALEIGLVEFVYPTAKLLDQVLKMAETIASYSGLATAATKKCINIGLREGISVGLAHESDLRAKTGGSPDAVEGRNAFLEKRTPDFNKQKQP